MDLLSCRQVGGALQRLFDTIKKPVMFNNAWTRDSFEALYRYGIDYRRCKAENAYAVMVEENSATRSITSSRDEGGVEFPATTEISEGIIMLEPAYRIWAEGESITFDMMKFKYGGTTYMLQVSAYWAESELSETGLRLAFGGWEIKEIEE